MKMAMKSKWLLVPIIGLLLLFLASLFIPFFTGVSYRSPIVVQLANLREIGQTLKDYAADHGGYFPAHISDLPAGSIPESMRKFHDPATKEAHDWLYFAGHKIDDPGMTVLAASTVETFHDRDVRVHTGGDRVVLFVDGKVRIMGEADFQRILSTQPK